jgi:hypothetical protein
VALRLRLCLWLWRRWERQLQGQGQRQWQGRGRGRVVVLLLLVLLVIRHALQVVELQPLLRGGVGLALAARAKLDEQPAAAAAAAATVGAAAASAAAAGGGGAPAVAGGGGSSAVVTHTQGAVRIELKGMEGSIEQQHECTAFQSTRTWFLPLPSRPPPPPPMALPTQPAPCSTHAWRLLLPLQCSVGPSPFLGAVCEVSVRAVLMDDM